MSNLYKNKRVAILRGYPQLIDGETASVEEMYQWGLKNGIEFTAYHLHPVWKKKKPEYSNGYDHTTVVFHREMVKEIKEELNKFDLIILINPARMISGLKQADVRAFHDMYIDLDPVKVMMQHNHVPKTMNSIPFLYSYLTNSDKIMMLSESGYYQDVVQSLPIPVKIDMFNLWRDIKSHGDIRNNKDRKDQVTYVGRYSPYKGPVTLLNISTALEHYGLSAVLYGMDSSIGCKTAVLNHPKCINVLQKQEKNEGETVPAYGLLAPTEVIPTLNKSMFSSHLFTLRGQKEYETFGSKLEYVMQEAIIAGAILVVSKEWAEWCKSYDDRRWIDIPNFAVVVDTSMPNEGILEMQRIIKDPELADKYRQSAYNYLYSNYEIDEVLPKLLNKLFSIPKKPATISVENLIKAVVKTAEADKLIEVYNQGDTAIPMSPNSLKEDVVRVFGGKSGKALEKIE